MADQANEETAQSSSGLLKIILPVAAVLIAIGGGFATYLFVLAPMVAPPADQEAEEERSEPPIPANPITITFSDIIANSLREGDEPRAMILASVTLECASPETSAIIERHRPRFRDMILKEHQSPTQAELDDVLLLQESIQRRIEQKANDILSRVLAESNPQIRVTDVFHGEFAVQDAL